MNPPLDLHCGPPDPTASPLDIVQLFALIDSHLSGEILGSYVPYVMGSPNAIPGVMTVRIHALRVLKNKFPAIMDAIDPGGSGD